MSDWLRFRSLKWIIIPALLGMQLAVFGVLAWQSVGILREMALEQAQHRVQTLQVELQAALAAPLLERDYSTLQEIVDELTRASDLAYLAIYDRSGKRIVTAGSLPAGDDTLLDTRIGLEQGEVRLGLRVAESGQIFFDFLRRTAPMVVLGLLLTTLWMVVVTLWIVRRLQQLTGAAEALGSGLLTVRAPEHGYDELGRLGQAFNRMAAAVQSADERWARSQRFTDTLLMAMPMPVFYKDKQGRYLGCNDAFARVTGLSRYDIRGKRADELWPLELAALHCQHDEALWRGEGHQGYPGSLLDQAGNRRQVIFSKDVFYDDMGEVAGVIGAWNDITELREAEGRLRLLAGVFKHSREGIAIADARGRVIDVNRALCQISGYSRDDVLGSTPQRFFSGRHEPAFYQAIFDTLRRKGYWQGEVWNRRKDGVLFPVLLSISASLDPQGEVRNYIAVFADISLLKEQEARLDRMAHHDPLTQLPNRVLLAERMQQAIVLAREHGGQLAICFMDLDGFKRINDRYGHDIGDQLLIQVAERLRMALRGADTVARLGGDEFALLLSGLPDQLACHASLQRVLDTVAQPYAIGDLQLQISASIGVTLYPQDADDPDTLLRHADQAMYRAKEAGRNGYQIFDAEDDRQRRTRSQSLQRLQQALLQGELQLYYQPKVNMHDGKLQGAEALLRWHHPERGVLAPGSFLAAIEDSELDIQLGEWVLRQALAQMEAWRGEGLLLAVSVNISAYHLQQPNFAQSLAAILQDYPAVPRDMLEIEVLESTALSDIDRVSGLMRDCQALGVRFSLDDFGTGYSSLLYLKRLPADKLKIDQSFVRGMHENADDLAIVQGIIGLSEAFNRQLVAEGVETVAHGSLLLSLGCEVAQGYAIARPMPAAEVLGWVHGWHGHPEWQQAAHVRWSQQDIALFGLWLGYRSTLQRLLQWPAERGADWDDDGYGALARWYLGDGRVGYGSHGQFAALGELLPRISQHSHACWQAWRQGQQQQAQALSEQLQALCDEMAANVYALLGRRGELLDALT